jgi:catechol 2,3-dioxygenase-like lactoylglutathione lyase family enzyme
MADLDNLRKQAKRILRWHAERHHPVAAAIREALPRFRNLADGDILAARFTLADAQEMVARQNGCESWQALRSRETPMTTSEKPAAEPRFAAAEPCIFVSDFARARDFYVGKLGFTPELSYGEPPYFGLVARGAARLALRLVKEPVFVGDVRERQELLAASLTLAASADIKALFEELLGRDVGMFQRLRTEPWGARTFIVRDPDGNLLLFAGPAA